MKNFINWIKGVLDDSEGHPSSKRVVAFIILIFLGYSVIAGDPEMVRVLGGIMLLSLGITIPDKFARRQV